MRNVLSRRTALRLLASSAGTIVVAACTPVVPGPAPTVSAGPAGSGTATPKAGGTLRYGSNIDVNQLDPHFRLADVYYTVYDRLTEYDVNHNVQPMLAESWDVPQIGRLSLSIFARASCSITAPSWTPAR